MIYLTQGKPGAGMTLSVRPPLASEPTARSLAAPVVVRSVAGTRTRVHKLDNHFAWLSVSLHLMSQGVGARSLRPCADALASTPPLSNTGINKEGGAS